MGRLLDEHLDVIDAIEWNAMYTRSIDFNRDAKKWADAHGKPVVGNSDLHLLTQMGTTWTEVDAEPDADAICDAIRAGRVQLHTQPLPLPRAVWLFTRMVVAGLPGGPKQHHGREPIDRDDGE
jgi:predicted metal-dependent phosphoesterase TrpH